MMERLEALQEEFTQLREQVTPSHRPGVEQPLRVHPLPRCGVHPLSCCAILHCVAIV